MAEPTKKAPEIDNLIDSLSPPGFKRTTSIKMDMCSRCGEKATEFRDEVSRREYRISGWCQKCQDEMFGGDDDGDDA